MMMITIIIHHPSHDHDHDGNHHHTSSIISSSLSSSSSSSSSSRVPKIQHDDQSTACRGTDRRQRSPRPTNQRERRSPGAASGERGERKRERRRVYLSDLQDAPLLDARYVGHQQPSVRVHGHANVVIRVLQKARLVLAQARVQRRERQEGHGGRLRRDERKGEGGRGAKGMIFRERRGRHDVLGTQRRWGQCRDAGSWPSRPGRRCSVSDSADALARCWAPGQQHHRAASPWRRRRLDRGTAHGRRTRALAPCGEAFLAAPGRARRGFPPGTAAGLGPAGRNGPVSPPRRNTARVHPRGFVWTTRLCAAEGARSRNVPVSRGS